jgi:TrmH family RNA methyltransferase
MNMRITSTSNSRIKWIRSLHKNSARREEGVFLVEGAKEVVSAIDGGYTPLSLFIYPEITSSASEQGSTLQEAKDFSLKSQDFSSLLAGLNLGDIKEVYEVSKECYEKVSYRSGTNGIVGVFQAKNRSLDELTFGDNPLFIVVESVEKPGNLGAIIRTADGAGVDGVIICDEKADVFNPNVIRASVGTVFSKQVVASTNQEVHGFLQKHKITPYGAILSDKSETYTKADLTKPTALVLGTEHDGLTDFWVERSKPIQIPMNGTNDSLNVSNAAAVLTYEAVRQRSSAGK